MTGVSMTGVSMTGVSMTVVVFGNFRVVTLNGARPERSRGVEG
jgi:hypothetical protein